MTMKKPVAAVLAVLVFALSASSSAHEEATKDPTSSMDVPVAAQGATAVVDRFGAALQKADLATVEAILDPDVLILESGGAERNRKEYLGHHAPADAKFLKDAHIQMTHRTARRDGDLVWVGTESEVHTQKDGKPLTLLSSETMVLKLEGDDWRIVHIHWSSRPKK